MKRNKKREKEEVTLSTKEERPEWINPRDRYECPDCGEKFRVKQTLFQHKCSYNFGRRRRRDM